LCLLFGVSAAASTQQQSSSSRMENWGRERVGCCVPLALSWGPRAVGDETRDQKTGRIGPKRPTGINYGAGRLTKVPKVVNLRLLRLLVPVHKPVEARSSNKQNSKNLVGIELPWILQQMKI